MGFAVLIDIAGSVIVGGILLLTLFRMNDNATKNTYNFGGELIVQENLVTTVEVIEYDFRKIGYCEDPFKLMDPSRAILSADADSISYLTDVDFDGNLDVVQYKLGPASELTSTPNPNDRMLYRIVNGKKTGVNLGVTYFNIKYFDVLNKELTPPLSVPTGIASMQIDVEIQSTAAYDAGNNPFRLAFWRQIRLASRNLNSR